MPPSLRIDRQHGDGLGAPEERYRASDRSRRLAARIVADEHASTDPLESPGKRHDQVRAAGQPSSGSRAWEARLQVVGTQLANHNQVAISGHPAG